MFGISIIRGKCLLFFVVLIELWIEEGLCLKESVLLLNRSLDLVLEWLVRPSTRGLSIEVCDNLVLKPTRMARKCGRDYSLLLILGWQDLKPEGLELIF